MQIELSIEEYRTLLGAKKVQAMPPQDRLMAQQDHEGRYDEESERHGLDRLGIKE